MDFVTILSTKIKPELNHIYTEPPLQNIRDLGWYCREHTLHLYGLACLMHKRAEICLGDYILRRPGGDSFHSVGDSADHAWCFIDDCTPVDVSLTVKHIYPDIPDIALVYGDRSDLTEGFEIKHRVDATDDEFMKLTHHTAPLIAYNEKSRLNDSLLDLLSDPFRFLFKPPGSFPTFPDIFGAEVFYAITYHCYLLATGELKPLCRYMNDCHRTVTKIMERNPNAKNDIESIVVSREKKG